MKYVLLSDGLTVGDEDAPVMVRERVTMRTMMAMMMRMVRMVRMRMMVKMRW